MRSLLLMVAGAAALAGCTGGNNNKANNSAATAAATAATIAATVVRAVTPVATPATSRTSTPIATAARTATPSVVVRTPTPAPAGGAATPAADGTPAATGTLDAALQSQLEGAVLKESDIGAGFTKQDDNKGDLTSVGQTANYEVTYGKVGVASGGGADIQAVVIALGGFRDVQTTRDQFANLEKEITASAGGDFKLDPITNGPTVGDETRSFQVSGTSSGFTLGGYVIVWRRGRIASAIAQVGLPPPQSIDAVAALANKQDDALKSIRQ